MKKFLALSLTLILIFALSACAGNATDNTPIGDSTNQQNQNDTMTPSDSKPSDQSNQNQQQTEGTADITRQRAIEIALETAGVKQDEVRDLDVELDTDRDGTVWEIDFKHSNVEYSYDVDVKTGAITKADREDDN